MASGHSHSWHVEFAREYAGQYQFVQILPHQSHLPVGIPRDHQARRPALHPIPIPAPIIDEGYSSPRAATDLSVGIIGAGAAGLYIAMILDDLGISYKILEASTHAGGRVPTHRFANIGNNNKWNYFDPGAMRFPENFVMRRVFNLMRERLKIGDKLLPYYFTDIDKNQVLLYNGIRRSQREIDDDPGRDWFDDVPRVPIEFVKEGWKVWVSLCTEPFKAALRENWGKGWALLMKYDHHSTRSFMASAIHDDPIQKEAYPQAAINWLERMNGGTGAFDMAFSQMVLGDLAFNSPLSAVLDHGDDLKQQWFCIEGGSHVIIEAMLAKIKTKPTFSSRVTRIEPTDDAAPMKVTYTHDKATSSPQDAQFDYVLSTLSMGANRLVDLDSTNLTDGQKESMRTFAYASAIKIGLQFKSRWWEKDCGIKGGLTKTDRILRQVVYPSYGIDDPTGDAVLIASYCTSQDSQRLGTLMSGPNSTDEKLLIDLVLRELAILHDVELSLLQDQLVDFWAKDWYADRFTNGAWASFGPTQFQLLYPSWGQPTAGGRLIFAGEALSEVHGWIEGALRSGYWAVYKMLRAAQLHKELERLRKRWGLKEESEDDENDPFCRLMDKQVLYGAIFSAEEDAEKAKEKIAARLKL
ncbi:hypothetical protein BOTBODRAFT_237068 [Botryobasidium botryosum FD-172 SS1]|uniref:Amine oxidase domain-containing protein n=1 Tax=Botryobasidium botryosum (strain FD-172 SS1) TaxID=930990 RepID=A0A067MXN4_BOTB1|nr:hypothetical protein BOTBODRAFT_237068 [Botryobasidium botryosum FD-172 SS1]